MSATIIREAFQGIDHALKVNRWPEDRSHLIRGVQLLLDLPSGKACLECARAARELLKMLEAGTPLPNDRVKDYMVIVDPLAGHEVVGGSLPVPARVGHIHKL